MNQRPNILILMADQMQAAVLRPGHPCRTPNLDRLAARGIRFDRAYTPNAVCSPARASLMTGLLPHHHGVVWVTHNVDPDQACLRPDKPHFAQRLVQAGYHTGYFGKWHVEHSESPGRFGWTENCETGSASFKQRPGDRPGDAACVYSVHRHIDQPAGYRPVLAYGVTETAASERSMGVVVGLAGEFLDRALGADRPWCCFVSTEEPHDPFIAGRAFFDHYPPDSLALAANGDDPLTDKPNLYRRQAGVWANLNDRERREARACYYASISELDQQFGRLLDLVERAGRMRNTVVILLSDHGELLGAHGLYCKNISAFEEVYNIPLVMAGPGIVEGRVTPARVGLHDVAPTLLALAGLEGIGSPDSQSFAPLLGDPDAHAPRHTQGFAEYFGGRYLLTQRIVWDGPWKYVHNGFDFDELYDLDRDPGELHNLAQDPAWQDRLHAMARLMWRHVARTGDHTLLRTDYPPLRMAPVGPWSADAEATGPVRRPG